jgi:hypothetical protein
MDDMYGFGNSMAFGNSYFIHNGWADSYSARNRDHCGSVACHPGAKGTVNAGRRF